MKKLSFIMAVLMILMCLPVMAMTSASAAETEFEYEAEAKEPVLDTIGDNQIYSMGERTSQDQYKLVYYASDDLALADGAIGRYGPEGCDGYAMTFTAMGANMGDCAPMDDSNSKFRVFNFINNATGDRVIKGTSSRMDMALGGVRSDGGLVKGNGVTLYNDAARVSNITSNGAGPGVTFVDLTFDGNNTNSIVQIQYKSNVIFGKGVKIISSKNVAFNWGVVLQNDATLTIDGAYIEASAAKALVIDNDDGADGANGTKAKGVTTIIKSGTLINNGKGNIYGTTGTNLNKRNAKLSIYGGSFTANGGRLVRVSSVSGAEKEEQVSINIYGGNFIVKNFDYAYDAFNGTDPYSGVVTLSGGKECNVYGGTFSVFKDNGATLATETPIFYGWSGAKDIIMIYGGTFFGGCGYLARVAYSGDATAVVDTAKTVLYNHDAGTTSTTIGTVVNAGAAIRLNEKSGIRFSSTVAATTVNYIEKELIKEGTEVTYGTVITASDYLKYANGVFTKEALAAAGMSYVDVVAKDGLVKNADGSVTINASLVNIKEENYDRDFVSISYLTYTNDKDEVVTIYATNVNLAKFSRNAEEIAYAALADVVETAVGPYATEVSEYYEYNSLTRKYELVTGKAYSRYTADQLAIVKTYIK